MDKPLIFFATGNASKFAMVERSLTDHNWPFDLKQFSVDLDEIQSDDQKEIATFKAHQAWMRLRRPVLVEDAGLFFDSYHNFPGTLSKYIHQSIGFDGLRKLYTPGDTATFRVMFAYADEVGDIRHFESVLPGTVVEPRGTVNEKMPFSALFQPKGSDKTFQELMQDGGVEPFQVRVHAFEEFAKWYVAHLDH